MVLLPDIDPVQIVVNREEIVGAHHVNKRSTFAYVDFDPDGDSLKIVIVCGSQTDYAQGHSASGPAVLTLQEVEALLTRAKEFQAKIDEQLGKE